MNTDELRRALAVELDEPAPAPHTSLDEVVRLGRRRVRRTWLTAAGATALGVVVVIGLATLPPTPWSAPPPPADGPVPTATIPVLAFDWPRVDQPPRVASHTWTPGNTAPPPAGRPVVPIPQCTVDQVQDLKDWAGSLEVPAGQLASWQRSTGAVLPGVRVGNVQSRHIPRNPDKPGSKDSYSYSLDVTPADGGTGSITLSAGRFEDTPTAIANGYVWSNGDCQPPYRSVRPDGSVVQMHGVQAFEPFQSLVQVVRVYRPDGALYELRLQNWGSPDVRPDPRQPEMSERIGAGRPDLPLSEAQLAQIALTFTEL